MTHWMGLKSTVGKLLGVGVSVVKWCAVAHCTLEYVADCVVCSGPSMEPTIKTKDIILTEHITPQYGRISRNEIVVSRSPSNPRQFICKRVVGVEGDKVVQPDGSLTEIPRGYVWVEGDNVYNSTDSRSYGPIPVGLIRGRALLRVWPLTDVGTLMPNRDDHL